VTGVLVDGSVVLDVVARRRSGSVVSGVSVDVAEPAAVVDGLAGTDGVEARGVG
jgi:hypothetical protein